MAGNGQQRTFGLVLAGLLLVLGAGAWYERGDNWWVPVAAGLLILLLAFLRPAWLAPLERLFVRVGGVLGRVTTPVLLTLVYLVVLVPTALLARVFGKRFLARDMEPGRESYWEDRRSDPEESSWYRQF